MFESGTPWGPPADLKEDSMPDAWMHPEPLPSHEDSARLVSCSPTPSHDRLSTPLMGPPKIPALAQVLPFKVHVQSMEMSMIVT
jgi:hypothetical protein